MTKRMNHSVQHSNAHCETGNIGWNQALLFVTNLCRHHGMIIVDLLDRKRHSQPRDIVQGAEQSRR